MPGLDSSPHDGKKDSAECTACEHWDTGKFRALLDPWTEDLWEAPNDPRRVPDWLNSIEPEDRDAALRDWRRAVQRRVRFNGEYRTKLTNGDSRWINIRAAPVQGPDGEIECWAGMSIDITDRRRIEEALRQSERRFRAVFNQQFQFMAILSPEGVVVEMNEMPLRYSGVPREDVLGKLFWNTPFWKDLPEMRRNWPERLRHASQSNAPVLSIDEYETSDGRVRLADAAVTAVRDHTGQVEFFMIQASDITERRHIEAERERETRRLHLLADAAHRLLSSASPEQIVREIFDRLAPELELDIYFNFMLAPSGDVLLLDSCAGITEERVNLIRTYPLGTPVCGVVAQTREELTLSHLQDTTDPARDFLRGLGVRAYSCNPLLVGERLLGTLSFGSTRRDAFTPEDLSYLQSVCRFVALAQERALHQRELEKRVEERTRKLTETVGELEAFSYSVSHDLRAPLRAMQGYSHFLLQDYAERLDETGRNYIERIVNAAERLDRLVSDILTYSRVARTDLQSKPIDLERLIHDVVQSYPELRPEHSDIQIQTSLHAVVGHEGSLIQCLSNLLSNAVKFVPQGIKPSVRIWTTRENDRVRVHIEDNGIGIAAEDHQRIFQMFEKAARHLGYEGTGIGLAIVRKAVERMGGQVGLESRIGHGSRFWIELPAPPPGP